MKLESYEIREALRARDWRAATQCLARHFDIVDWLPPFEAHNIRESNRLDVAASLIVGYRGKYWCWNSVSGFATAKSVTYYRYAELWAEYCSEA